MLLRTGRVVGLWLGCVSSSIIACGSPQNSGDAVVDSSSDGGSAAEASVRACEAGGWCAEPHSGSTEVAPSAATAAFAGPLSAPPLAVFYAGNWATRNAGMQWSYSAYPAPSTIDGVATAMRGFSPGSSWVGVANNAVYHWSAAAGMRGFSMGEGATVVAAIARAEDDLWALTVRAAAPGSGERPTIVARHWREGAWVDVDVPAVAEVESLTIDSSGALVVLGFTRQPPGVIQYGVQRVLDSGAEMAEQVMLRSQSFQSNTSPGSATLVQDAAGALWLSNGDRLWRRATPGMPWSEVVAPTGTYRLFASERGIAVAIRNGDAYSMVEFDSASLVMSARSVESANLLGSALYVINAGLWRADRDRSIWRLSTP